MLDLSVFCDESGSTNGASRYRIVTLVFHNQSNDISEYILNYQRDLKGKQLQDIPFHAGPLMYAKGSYEHIDLALRRRMFASFSFFQNKLPYKYVSFIYKSSELKDEQFFMARLKRDLVVFLADNLSFFQSFERVKIYYDDGQKTISKALHAAFEYELSKEAILYKGGNPCEYRLSQVADYLCTLELTALKFESHETTATDEKFFGKSTAVFKRDYLKKVRKKLL